MHPIVFCAKQAPGLLPLLRNCFASKEHHRNTPTRVLLDEQECSSHLFGRPSQRRVKYNSEVRAPLIPDLNLRLPGRLSLSLSRSPLGRFGEPKSSTCASPLSECPKKASSGTPAITQRLPLNRHKTLFSEKGEELSTSKSRPQHREILDESHLTAMKK